MSVEGSVGAGDRSFVIVVLMIALATLLLHLDALRRPHVEGDEILFTFLAEQLRSDATAYRVRGELEGASARRFVRETWEPLYGRPFPDVERVSLLFGPPDRSGERRRAYDAEMYDQPLFFHPPLYPYLLSFVRAVFGTEAGILLSALFHVTTVGIVALLGRMLADERVGLMAAGLMAVEAVSWVDAERVWIDGMAQMMVAAAVLAAVWSARNGSAWRHAIAGSVLGLAGLTKLPAGLVAPAVLVVWLLAPRRPRKVEIVAYLLPPTLLVGAWLSISKISLGAFIPVQWPTEWIIREYPWIKHTLERSPLTYVSVLLLVSPALAFALVGASRVRRSPWLLVPLAWAVAFWLGLTALGAAGMGFQLRFIAPGIPALCLLAAAGVQSLSRPWRIAVVPLCVYSLLVGSQSALAPGNVDPRPQPLWGAVLELFGRDPSGIPEF